MTKRLKQPGESTLRDAIYLSINGAAAAFLFLFFRTFVSFHMDFAGIPMAMRVIWGVGFGFCCVIIAVGCFAAAAIRIRGE